MLLGFHLVWVIDLFRNRSKIMTAPARGPTNAKLSPPTLRSLPTASKGSRVKNVWLDSRSGPATNLLCSGGGNCPSVGFCVIRETRGLVDPSSKDIPHFLSSALTSNNFLLDSTRSDKRNKKKNHKSKQSKNPESHSTTVQSFLFSS